MIIIIWVFFSQELTLYFYIWGFRFEGLSLGLLKQTCSRCQTQQAVKFSTCWNLNNLQIDLCFSSIKCIKRHWYFQRFFDDFLSMTLSTLPLVGFIFVICPLARMFFYCWSICAYIALYSTQMHSVKVVKFQWVFELLSFVVEMIQFDDYIKLGASTTNYKVGPLPVIYIYT